MSYSYAADKQITAETIDEDVLSDTSFTAQYDAGNRISNWTRAGAPTNNAQSWSYDDAGNWISTTKDGTTEARNHSVADQITQIAKLPRPVPL